MTKRQDKGGIWILVLVVVCISLLFLLSHKSRKNPSLPSDGQMEQATTVQREESADLQEEKEQLWILFDNLKFTRKNMQPKILFYAGILILYIVLIGPVAYFLLKKLDKMSWMWGYIPIMAVLFSAIIMGFNAGTKVTEPMVDALTVLSPQKDNVVYVASTSPGKRSYELLFGEEVKKVLPLYMGGEYEFYGENILKKNRSYTILDEPDKTTLCLNPKSAFTRDYFRLDLDRKEKKELDIALKLAQDTTELPEGMIGNDTDFDYSYLFVYYKEEYCIFRNIRKNDRIEVTKKDWKSIYHQDNIRSSAKKNNKDDVKRLLRFAYEKYLMEADDGKVYVFGVLPEYESAVRGEGKKLISRGLFYQWYDF